MEKEFFVKIEGEEWKNALEKSVKKINKNTEFEGFRRGKAPMELVMNKCKDEVYEEAIDLVIEKVYKNLCDIAGNIKIVAEPDISLVHVDRQYAEFKFLLTLPPKVKLGKYTNLKMKKKNVKVTKKEIEEYIEELRIDYIDYVEKEQVEDNDYVNVELSGIIGKNDKFTEEDYWFIADLNEEYPGLSENVLGMKKDEEKDFKMTFAKDYFKKDLAGKTYSVKVKVKNIKKEVLPELNQDFFEDIGMGDIKTKEEFEKEIEEQIRQHKEFHVEDEYVDELIEKVIKNSEFEVPEAMLKTKINDIIDEYPEEIEEQELYDIAFKMCQVEIVFNAIAEKEQIKVTQEEIEEEINEFIKDTGITYQEFLDEIGLEEVESKIKFRKVINIMKEE